MIEPGSLRKPYLLFMGDVSLAEDAKTALGIAHWRPEWCVGQLRLPGCAADAGLPDLSVAEAAARGAGTLVVGVAPQGGQLDPAWVSILEEALAAGLDVAAGLHVRLADHPRVREAADRAGRRVHDIRHPRRSFGAAVPRRRTGRRILTVGTDCAVGKKYTALALHREMSARGFDVSFRATGQTGMFIAESGVAIDAVVADFIAGAAEWLTPDAPPTHWDVIEGQGALCHPVYAGVTLGLVHGSQPDGIVLCHKAGNTHLMDWPDVPLPELEAYAEHYLWAARVVNPDVRLLGVSLNTSAVEADDRPRVMREMERRFGLPCVDPVRTGTGPIVDRLAGLP